MGHRYDDGTEAPWFHHDVCQCGHTFAGHNCLEPYQCYYEECRKGKKRKCPSFTPVQPTEAVKENIMEKTVLTHSSLKAFRTCQRKYDLSYVKGYRPVKDSEPLYFGKLFHAGLEAWSKSGRSLEPAREAVYALFKAAPEQDEYLLAKVMALLKGYHERYQGEGFQIVAVETQFAMPVLNPDTMQTSRTFELRGVIDRIIMDDGRHKIQEIKTTSQDISPDSDYWRFLSIDPQISTYYLGAQAALELKIESCLYDVIRKPGLQPSQVPIVDADGVKIVLDPTRQRVKTKDGKKWRETSDTAQGYVLQTRIETPQEYYERIWADIQLRPEFYYARKEIPRSPNDLQEFLFDTWQTGQAIMLYSSKDKWPRNTGSCQTLYGKCPYAAVCMGMASLEDSSQFKKMDNVHQELKQENEAA